MGSGNQVSKDPDAELPNKVFIGGIPINYNESKVTKFFEQYGEVAHVKLIRKEGEVNCKGFGFVYFKNEHTMKLVLAMKHSIKGRRIEVEKALSQVEAKKRLEAHKELKLHLGGLPEDITENDLYDYFQEFGEIRNVYIIYDFDTKKSRGFGFIEFKKRKDADRCLNAEHIINGNEIIVSKMKLKNDIKKERLERDETAQL
jgi:RNA recognition motif-containing protein